METLERNATLGSPLFGYVFDLPVKLYSLYKAWSQEAHRRDRFCSIIALATSWLWLINGQRLMTFDAQLMLHLTHKFVCFAGILQAGGVDRGAEEICPVPKARKLTSRLFDPNGRIREGGPPQS